MECKLVQTDVWLSPSLPEGCIVYLSRPNLDVEVAPFVGDFEDLGPGEAVDPQPIAVDQQPVGTDTKHDVNPF